MTTKTPAGLAALMVRRWGEDEATPVVLDDRRRTHGSASDCSRRGCIGIEVGGGGSYRLVHLSTEEALRLSDPLRAMANADDEVPR